MVLHQNNFDNFKTYMDKYVREVVGKVKWRRYFKERLISKFVNISDESLTMLAIDNIEYFWKDNAIGTSSMPQPKYTSKTSMRRIQDGLSIGGQHKFNEYFGFECIIKLCLPFFRFDRSITVKKPIRCI